MADLKEMRETAARKVAEARDKLEQIDENTTEDRARELEQQFDSYMKEYDDLQNKIARREKLETAEKEMDAPTRAAPTGGDREVNNEGGEQRVSQEDAFCAFLRHGVSALDEETRQVLRTMRAREVEGRAQAAGTDTAGGYTVPQGFVAEVIETMKAYGPLNNGDLVRVLDTDSGNQIEWPTSDDTSNKGSILSENTQDSEQDITFGQKTLDAFKYTSNIIRISEELLQDSAINIGSFVARAMGERMGRIINEHMTTGSGSGEPNGIVTASTEGTTANSNSAITFEEILDLLHSVDPAYRSAGMGAAFMYNDNTLKALRKVKDNDGRFIWQPADARTGEPAQLYGYPYAINQDMPDIGANNKSVLFGAMQRYVMRRVRTFSTKRLVERYADFHQVGFIGFGRFDGELMDTAAVKHLVHPT
jgi:HK97 family phage major capsid protein